MARNSGLNVTAKFKGAKSSVANIRKMDKATRKAFFEELVKIAGEILQHSQDKYVPVLTGDLKNSGRLNAFPGYYPTVEIGFGGGAVDYAVLQHENLSFNHPRGGSAKYLELAVRDYEPTIEHRLAVATSGVMKLYDLRGKPVI